MYVANAGSFTVSVISCANNDVVANVSVGVYPVGVAYDSGEGEIFVVDDGYSSNTTYNNIVSVISDANNTVTKTVFVGVDPAGAAYDSSKGEVFVANSYVVDKGNSTVSIIQDSSLASTFVTSTDSSSTIGASSNHQSSRILYFVGVAVVMGVVGTAVILQNRKSRQGSSSIEAR